MREGASERSVHPELPPEGPQYVLQDHETGETGCRAHAAEAPRGE